MQLWINVVNNKIFENIENILYSDDRKVAQWFLKNLPWEVYENLSPQYEFQVMSAMQIRKVLWWNIFKNIKWFYFWTDQCEFLLPTVEEIKRAIEILKNFDKKYVTKELKRFVFVTPYYWNLNIRKRLIEDLQYLNDNAKYINPKQWFVEVVVNDFWTLKLIKDFNNLKPLLWRLLVKTLKNPIVDTLWLEKNIHVPWEMMKNKTKEQIEKIKKELAENQKKWFSRTSLTNKYFVKWVLEEGISRFSIDYQYIIDFEYIQDYFDKLSKEKEINLNLDIWYPYALIFVGRLCDTSAIENIRRWYFPIDEVCPRTCWRYDLFVKNFETVWYKIIQRWNAQYKSQIELNLPKNVIDVYENRLIYQPLI